jgi:hypothetical protein
MGIMLRVRTLPAGFIAPCLPTKTTQLPSGSQWLHEITRRLPHHRSQEQLLLDAALP